MSDEVFLAIELVFCGVVVLACEVLRVRSDRQQAALLRRARREWKP
jgi:hypothetical protein